jgi:23S rRNA (pseudouridine1915-N3)-methyltransferase
VKVVCLTVGKKHSPEIAAAIETYVTRLTAYVDFGYEYVPSADIERESAAILKRLKKEDLVLLLDETGRQYDNRQLAGILDEAQQTGRRRVVFVIGGAYGVTGAVKDRSDRVISLSKLVFPHQLVRLILAEQLYRSFNLLAGGKYHHD